MNAADRFRRQMAVLNSARQREQDRDDCLIEVVAALAGTAYGEFVERIDGPTAPHRLAKNGRTYRVDLIVYADPETPGTLRLVFEVDDGGLNLAEPKTITRFIRAGEQLSVGEN